MSWICHWRQRALASLAVSGEAPEPASALGRHLTTCATCRREWQALSRLAGGLSNLPEITSSEALSERVLERVPASPMPGPSRRLQTAAWVTALLATGAALTLGLLRLRSHPEHIAGTLPAPIRMQPNHPAAAPDSPPEKPERGLDRPLVKVAPLPLPGVPPSLRRRRDPSFHLPKLAAAGHPKSPHNAASGGHHAVPVHRVTAPLPVLAAGVEPALIWR
jgi:hypothetical protein